MRRRRALHVAGPGAVGLVAGCVTDRPPAGGQPAPTRTPASGDPGRPSDEAPSPSYTGFHDDVDQVVGYDQVDPPSAPLVLEPSADARSPPDAAYTFVLRNQGDRGFTMNPYGWSIHRWEDGAWWYVAPMGAKVPLHEVAPGEAYSWHVSVTNERVDRPDLTAGGRADIQIRGLGGGTYAVGIDGWWTGEEEGRVVPAARFRVDADQLTLQPSRAVTEATKAGDTVEVTAENPGEDTTEPALYELTRVDDATDAAKTITETLLRSWPRRDAFAYTLPAVDRVRLEARTAGTPAFGVQDDWPALTYDGGTFETAARLEN